MEGGHFSDGVLDYVSNPQNRCAFSPLAVVFLLFYLALAVSAHQSRDNVGLHLRRALPQDSSNPHPFLSLFRPSDMEL
jgi:hypothetical protein